MLFHFQEHQGTVIIKKELVPFFLYSLIETIHIINGDTMKKIIWISCFLLLLTGCDFGKEMVNTPTKQVELFLMKYQMVDEDIMKDLNYVVAEEELFNTKQREAYKEIMKNHFKNLSYEIKDERIDKDQAVVTAEVKVNNHASVLEQAEKYSQKNESEFYDENGEFSLSKYTDYRLEKLKQSKERVTYTIDFTLTKDGKEWKLDPLSSENQKKINGIY